MLKKIRVSIIGLLTCALLFGVAGFSITASGAGDKTIKLFNPRIIATPKPIVVPKIIISNNKITVPKVLMNNINKIKVMKNAPKPHLVAKNDKPLDFSKILLPTKNLQLLERRKALKLINTKSIDLKLINKSLKLRKALSSVNNIIPLYDSTANVDWRYRFGKSYVTTVRNQGGASACWVFSATALVESMVRIEHNTWTYLSEGDVHKGMGAKKDTLGADYNAVNWISKNGIADPKCFPWNENDVPYTPTSDRSGRTVRLNQGAVDVKTIADQKRWLDVVGPISTYFEVWTDFFAFQGDGIYKVNKNAYINGVKNKAEGGHDMLIVGYNDKLKYWIVKNSWGDWWGNKGYCKIGYGQCDIDRYWKVGLQGTNPDPWTKRSMHSGIMLESGNGAGHNNFEMLARGSGTSKNKLQQWYRENSNNVFTWHKVAAPFGNDVASFPTFMQDTVNRNYVTFYLTPNGRLHEWTYEQSTGKWKSIGVFGTNLNLQPTATEYLNHLSVVTATKDGRLSNWESSNLSGNTWQNVGIFGNNVLTAGSMILSHYGVNQGNDGHQEVVCTLKNGQMQHWYKEENSTWKEASSFGSGITTAPCMIESQHAGNGYLTNEKDVGNFELCVAAGGKVQHWWCDNTNFTGWKKSAEFGHDVAKVVSLIESTYGNLELVVLRTDNMLQHYVRDSYGTWYEDKVIGPSSY